MPTIAQVINLTLETAEKAVIKVERERQFSQLITFLSGIHELANKDVPGARETEIKLLELLGVKFKVETKDGEKDRKKEEIEAETDKLRNDFFKEISLRGEFYNGYKNDFINRYPSNFINIVKIGDGEAEASTLSAMLKRDRLTGDRLTAINPITNKGEPVETQEEYELMQEIAKMAIEYNTEKRVLNNLKKKAEGKNSTKEDLQKYKNAKATFAKHEKIFDNDIQWKLTKLTAMQDRIIFAAVQNKIQNEIISNITKDPNIFDSLGSTTVAFIKAFKSAADQTGYLSKTLLAVRDAVNKVFELEKQEKYTGVLTNIVDSILVKLGLEKILSFVMQKITGGPQEFLDITVKNLANAPKYTPIFPVKRPISNKPQKSSFLSFISNMKDTIANQEQGAITKTIKVYSHVSNFYAAINPKVGDKKSPFDPDLAASTIGKKAEFGDVLRDEVIAYQLKMLQSTYNSITNLQAEQLPPEWQDKKQEIQEILKSVQDLEKEFATLQQEHIKKTELFAHKNEGIKQIQIKSQEIDVKITQANESNKAQTTKLETEILNLQNQKKETEAEFKQKSASLVEQRKKELNTIYDKIENLIIQTSGSKNLIAKEHDVTGNAQRVRQRDLKDGLKHGNYLLRQDLRKTVRARTAKIEEGFFSNTEHILKEDIILLLVDAAIKGDIKPFRDRGYNDAIYNELRKKKAWHESSMEGLVKEYNKITNQLEKEQAQVFKEIDAKKQWELTKLEKQIATIESNYNKISSEYEHNYNSKIDQIDATLTQKESGLDNLKKQHELNITHLHDQKDQLKTRQQNIELEKSTMVKDFEDASKSFNENKISLYERASKCLNGINALPDADNIQLKIFKNMAKEAMSGFKQLDALLKISSVASTVIEREIDTAAVVNQYGGVFQQKMSGELEVKMPVNEMSYTDLITNKILGVSANEVCHAVLNTHIDYMEQWSNCVKRELQYKQETQASVESKIPAKKAESIASGIRGIFNSIADIASGVVNGYDVSKIFKRKQSELDEPLLQKDKKQITLTFHHQQDKEEEKEKQDKHKQQETKQQKPDENNAKKSSKRKSDPGGAPL